MDRVRFRAIKVVRCGGNALLLKKATGRVKVILHSTMIIYLVPMTKAMVPLPASVLCTQLWQNQYEQRYPITKVLAGPLANRAISGSLCGQSWFNIGCTTVLELCEHLDITTADTTTIKYVTISLK